MSDEESLGTVCFIPRRFYVLFFAICFLVYGIYNAMYYTIFHVSGFATMTPSHCSGPRCNDLLTCAATQESSYHLRLCVLMIGSLVFGISGVNACLGKYADDMCRFAFWCVAAGVLLLAIMLFDGAYLVLCGSHYSFNVVSDGLLWPVPDLPVKTGIKYEIRQLDTYPKGYVDALVYHNVGLIFASWTLLRVFFLFHAAYNAFILSERFHYGLAGMGATFSIESWQERLKMRDEVQEVGYNTLAMMKTTGMDLGWEGDEYREQRLDNRPRHWYRGQPAAGARAYDGFQDDRRNVLL